MKAYENNIICGETLSVMQTMPDSIVDLGITSPPYNKQEKNRGWLVDSVVYDQFRDCLPEHLYQEQQIAVLNEIFRVTKAGGSFFYNHKIRWVRGEMLHPMDWLRKTDWTIKQEIVWDRTLAGNIRGWRFWQVEERIYWLYKGVDGNNMGRELRPQDAKLTSIWRAVPENKNPHPAPFPLWLPARIILSLLRECESGLVLDPYMGSGTTAVAAKLLGFDFFGTDISPHYVAYAQQRLRDSDKEADKIQAEKARHVVRKTFKDRKNEGVRQPQQAAKTLW